MEASIESEKEPFGPEAEARYERELTKLTPEQNETLRAFQHERAFGLHRVSAAVREIARHSAALVSLTRALIAISVVLAILTGVLVLRTIIP